MLATIDAWPINVLLLGKGNTVSPEALAEQLAACPRHARLRPSAHRRRGGCRHHAMAEVTLDPSSHLRWREELVLGRHNEPSGVCASRLDVVIADVPLYRSELLVGSAATDQSSAVLCAAGAVGSVLLAGREWARPAAAEEGLAVLPLAGPGTAITATAPDAATLSRRLDHGELLAAGA